MFPDDMDRTLGCRHLEEDDEQEGTALYNIHFLGVPDLRSVFSEETSEIRDRFADRSNREDFI